MCSETDNSILVLFVKHIMTYRIFAKDPPKALQAMMYDVSAKMSLGAIHSSFLPWSISSLRPAALQLLMNDIVLNSRRVAVEFGSGLSTVFLAVMMARQGGKVLSVDHNAEWQELVASWIPASAREAVNFVACPLKRLSVDNQSASEWYSVEPLTSALQGAGPVDLVLVDGPPAYQAGRELARAPAVPAVRRYLGPSATIVLDDIMRPGETTIAAQWSDLLATPYRDLTVQAGVGLWQLGVCNNIEV